MMRNVRSRPRPFSTTRKSSFGNPLLKEEIHDPYRTPAKAKGPARCPDCDATYVKGRWTWARLTPSPVARLVCPACRRVRDRMPAGEITLRGTFLATHADEALRVLHNVATAESRDHPLHRIMDVRRDSDGMTVTTTDIHLPRRIVHALEASWRGATTIHYDEGGHFARASWERND
jgi:hypothetical protein